jgi:hypothetical protein
MQSTESSIMNLVISYVLCIPQIFPKLILGFLFPSHGLLNLDGDEPSDDYNNSGVSCILRS